ncbi:MAG: hypothetical protein ACRBCK_07275 [Alphaproteobacteria bacterium]
MGAAIDTDRLTMGDMSSGTWGSFSAPEGEGTKNLDYFKSTYFGQAQIEVIQKEAMEQMAAQGVEDYSLSDSKINRILWQEQVSQAYGGEPDVTNKEMVEMTESGFTDVMQLVGIFDEVSDPNAVNPDTAPEAAADEPAARGTGYYGVQTGTDRAMEELNNTNSMNL